ncbi:3-hydroxylacyl-ACP dehydratase [Candidatus Rariloculus sp.]|uniref:ApeP family dehydratase n=1 Tax=Candidatus Rariloculus sp. TaxID=3101265 RepID=UPI003D0E922F
MNPEPIPATELLPHGPEMTLIDRLVVSDAERSVAVVEILPGSEFAESGGVPVWVGIEYMAQTIAARAGFEARLNGEPPPIGFLVGTRKYTCSISVFPIGSRLEITAKPLFVESGFGAFDCTIASGGVVASAILNTYRPTEAMLAEISGEK